MEHGIIEDVIITPLSIIKGEKGDIYKVLTSAETGFNGFGEAYFSTIYFGEIKGWKKHSKMLLNITVPIGHIRFYIYDDRTASKSFDIQMQVDISQSSINYKRLTIPPGLWVAFEGIGNPTNLLLNIANIIHDPSEAYSETLEHIKILR